MERPKEYRLQGVHFHAPSENTIDGVAYPLEMHAVHAAADGSLAVLGVMYEHAKNAHVELHEAGKHDEENVNEEVAAMLKHATHEGMTIEADPSKLYDGASGFWKWDGSLTTPPCTEGVLWMLQSEIMELPPDAIAEIKSHVGEYPGNARPTQQLNGRVVETFVAQATE